MLPKSDQPPAIVSRRRGQRVARLVQGDVPAGQADPLQGLADDRGLACLARARHGHHQPLGVFGQQADDGFDLRALEGGHA